MCTNKYYWNNDFVKNQILAEYNEGHQKIDMVLFDMALEHLTRIHRVLKMDTGHVMLIAVGGSGKAFMTKIAAFAAGMYFW